MTLHSSYQSRHELSHSIFRGNKFVRRIHVVRSCRRCPGPDRGHRNDRMAVNERNRLLLPVQLYKLMRQHIELSHPTGKRVFI